LSFSLDFTSIIFLGVTNYLTICDVMAGMLWLCTHHWNGDKLWCHSLSEFNPVNNYYLGYGQGGASCFQVWFLFLKKYVLGFNSKLIPLDSYILLH